MQRQKIGDGFKILIEHGLKPGFFFAPSHTYDENTLVALKERTDIRIISDTIATRPYRKGDFVFLPQMGGHCREMRLSGIWTFCLHPSTMTEDDFTNTEIFLRKHRSDFIGFDELELRGNLGGKDLASRLLSWAYFTKRRLKGIK